MANYTVDIELALKARAAERKLKEIETLVTKIDNRVELVSARFKNLAISDKPFDRVFLKLKGIETLQKRSLDLITKRTKRLQQEERLGTKANSTAAQRAQRLQEETGLLAGLKKLEKTRQDILEATRITSAQRLGDLRAQTREMSKQAKLSRMLQEGENIRASYRADARKRQRAATAETARARQQSNRGLQNAALGVGFPLLFGGGLGSIAGGLLGSAGGFGGQILGSAIGQQFDKAVEQILKVSDVVSSTAASFEFLSENALYSNDQTKKLAKRLADLGKVQELAKLNAGELVKLIGNKGVQSLQDLNEEWKDLLSGVAELGLAIGGFLSQYLQPLVKFLNDTVGNINQGNRLRALQKDLEGTPEGTALAKRIAELKKQNQEKGQIEGATVIRADGLTNPQVKGLLEEFQPLNTPKVKIPVTDQDIETFQDAIDSAAADELQIQREISRELLKQAKLEQDIATVGLSDIDRVAKELENFDKITTLKRDVLIIEEEDARLLEKKLQNLDLERTLQRELLLIEQGKARAAEKLRGVEAAQQVEAVNNAAQTAIDAANLRPSGNKNADQLAALQLRQFTQRTNQVRKYDNAIESLTARQSELAEADQEGIKRLQQQIDTQQRLKDAYLETRTGVEEAQIAQLQFNQVLQDAMPFADAFASSLTSGLQELIAGTKTAEEAFADFLRNIADVFMKTAAQMIAQSIALGVAKMFAGLNTGTLSGANPGNFNLNAFAGAFTPGGSMPFAEGGYVSSPTRAIIGEGGEPEYVIPASKMRESMTRYSRGARGSDVIPKAGASGASGEGGATAVSAPIDVRFNVERINNVDYVTAEQFQQGLQQAARQGAAEGERRTMRSLQNSTAVRRRLSV